MNILIFFYTICIIVFLQVLRAFISAVVWNLNSFVGSINLVVLFAVGVFASVFTVIILQKVFSNKIVIMFSTSTLILTRLIMQIFHTPGLRIIFSSLGVISFLIAFISLINTKFSEDKVGIKIFNTVLAPSIIADTVIRLVFDNYEYLWRTGVIPITFCVIITIIFFILLYLVNLDTSLNWTSEKSATISSVLTLGPFLFLIMILLQNSNAISGYTGLSENSSSFVVFGGALIGYIGSRLLGHHKYGNIILSVLFCVTLYMIVTSSSFDYIIIIFSVAIFFYLFSDILSCYDRKEPPRYFLSSLAIFISFIIFLVFVFVAGQFQIYLIIPIAGVIMLLLTIINNYDESSLKPSINNIILFAVITSLIVIIKSFTGGPSDSDEVISKTEIRVLTYNIHHGLSADYIMDVQGIIETIKLINPDIVCLQEVDRAEITNGMADNLAVIASQLNMKYHFAPMLRSGQYGNAVLSRLPVNSISNKPFSVNAGETRTMQEIKYAVKSGEITIVNNHLDYHESNEYRKPQCEELISIYKKSPKTIIVGDLNASQDKEEIMAFFHAGFLEAGMQGGLINAPTFFEAWDGKAEHLDYMFYTTDLTSSNFNILEIRTSDHKPVFADFK